MGPGLWTPVIARPSPFHPGAHHTRPLLVRPHSSCGVITQTHLGDPISNQHLFWTTLGHQKSVRKLKLARLPGLSRQPFISNSSSCQASRGSTGPLLLAWQGRRAFSGTGESSSKVFLAPVPTRVLDFESQNFPPTSAVNPVPAIRYSISVWERGIRHQEITREKQEYHWFIPQNNVLLHHT